MLARNLLILCLIYPSVHCFLKKFPSQSDARGVRRLSKDELGTKTFPSSRLINPKDTQPWDWDAAHNENYGYTSWPESSHGEESSHFRSEEVSEAHYEASSSSASSRDLRPYSAIKIDPVKSYLMGVAYEIPDDLRSRVYHVPDLDDAVSTVGLTKDGRSQDSQFKVLSYLAYNTIENHKDIRNQIYQLKKDYPNNQEYFEAIKNGAAGDDFTLENAANLLKRYFVVATWSKNKNQYEFKIYGGGSVHGLIPGLLVKDGQYELFFRTEKSPLYKTPLKAIYN